MGVGLGPLATDMGHACPKQVGRPPCQDPKLGIRLSCPAALRAVQTELEAATLLEPVGLQAGVRLSAEGESPRASGLGQAGPGAPSRFRGLALVPEPVPAACLCSSLPASPLTGPREPVGQTPRSHSQL